MQKREPPPILRLHAVSGLGDRLLDGIGYATLCRTLGYADRPKIAWDSGQTDFNRARNRSSYGKEQFATLPWTPVSEADIVRGVTTFSGHTPGFSFFPEAIESVLLESGSESRFREIVDAFVSLATEITPSPAIRAVMPADIGEAVGIHLRKSDKIAQRVDGCGHEVTVSEFVQTMSKLVDYVLTTYPKGTKFFVCSEDDAHKKEFKSFLRGASFVCIELGEDRGGGASADLADFFALSMCSTVVQGIKYSTFSAVAAIVGRKPLINLADFERTKNHTNVWAPLLVNYGHAYRWDANPHRAEILREYCRPGWILDEIQRALPLSSSTTTNPTTKKRQIL